MSEVTITVGGESSAEALAAAWVSDMAFENFATEDGRFVMADAVDWRELPLTLMAMIETTEGGHLGAQVAGRIDRIFKAPGEGDLAEATVIKSAGVFDTGTYGADISRLVGEDTLRGISIDFIVSEYAFRDPATGEIIELEEMSEDEWERAFMGELQTAFKKLTITAATVCPTPAFAPATISLAADGQRTTSIWFPAKLVPAEEALTAAAAGMAPLKPPAAWFENPGLDGPTALTFHSDGRVEGHLALWDSCHIGEPGGAGVCVTPPRSMSGYAYFHLGELECEDGSTVHVGKVTLDTGHADLRHSRAAATRHYDDTGTVVADVRAGEDAFGIWVAGAARPDIPAETLRSARSAVLSGDWRRVGTGLEMVAALGVNVGGFPVPRVAALVAPAEHDDIEALALVAAGICVEAGQEPMTQLELQGRMDALGMLAGVTELSLVAAPVIVITDNEQGMERGSLVDQLRVLLADVSTVAASARGFHWNVQGSDYSEASALYGAIYTDLSASIEQIADSIKQLGGQSPYALDDLQSLRNIPDASQTLTAVFDMTFQLRQQNEQLLAQLNSAFLAAAESEEQGIQNFLAERIDVHKRWAWQMRVQLAA